MSAVTDPMRADDVAYDLFISYRSEKSGTHAFALRDALYALDKRHSGVRPLRVFLDRVSLRAGSLAANISSGLRRSRHLVVLVDETTYRSPWVAQEIMEWLGAGGSPDRLFLVRTSPQVDLSWDAQAGRFRHPESLPAALATVFHAEQKYIDFLVPPRRVGEVDLIGLYTSVTGADPEQLGEDERRHLQQQRRRSQRFTAVLAGLLVVALVAAGMAVANFLRADAAARQARADALAAESLLTLPVSPARAIEYAVEASRLGEGSSIRSALLAVASDTKLLQRTFSLTGDSDAVTLTGLALSADDQTLSAWGPVPDGRSTSVVTWSTTSGDVMQRFRIDRPAVGSLVEVPGVAYLACAGDEALRIDWRTHEVTVLAAGQVGCKAHVFTGGGVLNLSRGEGDAQLVGVSITGREYREPGWVVESSRAAVMMPVEGFGGVVSVLTAAGVVPMHTQWRGSLDSLSGGTLLTRAADVRRHAITWTGDRLSGVEVAVPAVAVDAVAWLDYQDRTQAAWITATGAVGWTGGLDVLQLDDGRIGTTAGLGKQYPPTLALDRYGSLLATVGGALYKVSTLQRLTATPVAGSLGAPQSATNLVATSCEGTVLYGSGHYVVDGQLVDGSAELRNCHAVEQGPPVRVDGKQVVESTFADRTLSDVGNDGRIALARPDGTISIFAPWDQEAVPWRITPSVGATPAAGGSVTLSDGSPLLVESSTGTRKVSVAAKSAWVLPRPDGAGGIFREGSTLWLTVGEEIPRMLDPNCPASVAFEPGPGFTSDVAAAEAQQPVVPAWREGGRLDCLTGDILPDGPIILSYDIGPVLSHIVSREGGTVRVTTWQHGRDRTTVTRELPGNHLDARTANLSAAGDRVVLAGDNADLVEFRWDGAVWQAAGTYAATAGAPATVSYSPDASLLVVVTRRGQFDVFDTGTGRRLASQSAPLPRDLTYSGLSVQQRDGFLRAHLRDGDGGTVIEFPADAGPLRDLLCRVHPAKAC